MKRKLHDEEIGLLQSLKQEGALTDEKEAGLEDYWSQREAPGKSFMEECLEFFLARIGSVIAVMNLISINISYLQGEGVFRAAMSAANTVLVAAVFLSAMIMITEVYRVKRRLAEADDFLTFSDVQRLKRSEEGDMAEIIGIPIVLTCYCLGGMLNLVSAVFVFALLFWADPTREEAKARAGKSIEGLLETNQAENRPIDSAY